MNTNATEYDRTVTLRAAYQLLEAFIVQYHARGERSTVELVVILVLDRRAIQITQLSSKIF